MKKQVKKSMKKILILALAFSIVFTTCFSHKKMEVKAASVAAALGSYTLYEICLYFGGLAVSALGLGYVYENRDDIAEFGKTVIDNMSTVSADSWLFGSYSADSSYVYGTEALQEVQNSAWEVIQGGGGSPKNDDDNDGDGDKDADDRTLELDLTGYFLTQAGVNFFNDTIKPIYDKWVNKEEDNILDEVYGEVDRVCFNGFRKDSSGYYLSSCKGYFNDQKFSRTDVRSTAPMCIVIYAETGSKYTTLNFWCPNGEVKTNNGKFSLSALTEKWNNPKYKYYVEADVPVFYGLSGYNAFKSTGDYSSAVNSAKTYRVADWIADDEEWKGHLEDIATSLRSLQDLTTIAQRLSEGALTSQPSANEYGDMMDNIGQEIAPLTNPVVTPVYYPVTNPTPQLDPSELPNYVPTPPPGTNPDGGSDVPGDGGTDTPEDMEIDLDGLLSLFNILFYLIMIIIALILLFLSCLGFIAMIFKIPASPSMLPEEMVLGFEHLKTIMIPGMNISIYGFAMALIYLFIIFGVIKVLRSEINNFRFPRKGG